MTLEEYLAQLEARNWHTLAALIRLQRNQLDSEEQQREMWEVYLTAKAKRHAIEDSKRLDNLIRKGA